MGTCTWIDGTAASRYDLTDGNVDIVEGRYRHIASRLEQHDVLDVGCAYGIGTNVLLDEGFDAIGIDVDPNVVEHARELYPDVVFTVADVREMPELRTFDNIVLSDVIQHIPESEEILRLFDAEFDDGVIIGTTLQKGHPNVPDEKKSQNPGIMTKSEIRELIPDVQIYDRDVEIEHRFWFEVRR